MTQPRISIITPCRNQVSFIERTICSVLDQGYPDLQYIVVDGGSDDGSFQILRLYESQLSRLIRHRCHNLAQAVNLGLEIADGDIVGILYGDDLYLPGALDTVARLWKQSESPVWLVGHCLRISEFDQMLGELEPIAPRSLLAYLKHDSGLIPTVSCFWSRSLLDELGPWDASLNYASDYEFYCRLLAAGFQPQIHRCILAAKRELSEPCSPQRALQRGLEYIDVARRYADRLPLHQRYQLWANCDQRRRIYALAEAELHGSSARRFLWQQLIRHPWWLANNSIRHSLLRNLSKATESPVGTAA